MTSSAYLGVGLSFPLRLDATKTRPCFTQGEDRVFESIHAIICTRVGERPFRMKDGIPYGTRFQDMLFSDVDAAVDIADFDIRRALLVWEPRIRVSDISLRKYQDPQNKIFGVIVHILFTYRANNRPDNHITFFRSSAFG